MKITKENCIGFLTLNFDYHFTCIRSTVCTDRRITVIENNIKAGREIYLSFFHFCAINHKAAVLYI